MKSIARSSGAYLDRLAIVLVSTRNPLNIGAAARAMSNFGFRDLRVVNPYELAFREAKSAVGAADVLTCARVYSNVADAVADCLLVVGTTAARNRHLEQELKPLAAGGALVRKILRNRKVAVLFGSEKRGLSNDDLSYCHWLMKIPTAESVPAMNLGQAVALCLYEIAKPHVSKAKIKVEDSASGAELERLRLVLIEALKASDYAHLTEDKIRRLLLRLKLSSADAATLLGMLRQMLWKIQSGNRLPPLK